jgi:pimeloyl-ACP methyl ester carboxylesterase
MTPTDLVVVLPGIMGSTLRSEDGMVWAPSAGAALRAIATFGRSIKRLQLPDDIGDEHPDDRVEPVALMPDLHVLPGIWTPVHGYDPLLARLRSLGYREADDSPDAPPGNLLAVPYDWRLSNRYTAERLKTIVEPALERWQAQGGPCADARLVFVCHSMGGLVARWYIERCDGADITRKLITFGTPYRGALKALEQLVNGVDRRLGPFSLDLADFARSLPSLHQLLPEYACIEFGEQLLKTTETKLPDLCERRVADAMSFHTELRDAESSRAASLDATHAIVGVNQPTVTTARIADGSVLSLEHYGSDDLFGDSTVPLVAACRSDVSMDGNTLRRVPDKHGNLHRNRAALDELEGILTARHIQARAGTTADLRVGAPELALAGEQIPVEIDLSDDTRLSLRIVVTGESGRVVESRVCSRTRGTIHATVGGLAAGAYSIEVTDPSLRVAPVSGSILVWPRD